VAGSLAGCDPAFEWDGRDDRGDQVPAGVYLVRFKAEGVESVKKVVFRGEG
jgi:flagellar hook assembly protein FlgD